MSRILADGEQGKVVCEICLQEFDFTGNGEWIPAFCPECYDMALALRDEVEGHFVDGPTFEDLDAWFWYGVMEKSHG